MNKKIYLAIPYSHPDENIRIERFEKANKIASELINQGYFVYSPISHTHPIAMAGTLPLGWGFWQRYDTTFLEWADEIHVVKMDGWKQSKGVAAEIEIMKSMGKPVQYIEC